MGRVERSGKFYQAVMTYFKPIEWKKLQPKRRAMEKKEGRKISDSEFIKISTLKANKV